MRNGSLRSRARAFRAPFRKRCGGPLAFGVALALLAPLVPASAATGPAVTLGATTLTFGTYGVGITASAKTIQLTDSGDAPLTISTVQISGANADDFGESIDCPVAPATLAIGASCRIYVSFTPHSAGSKTATLTIGDNAATSPQTVALSGAGQAPPQVQLSPWSVGFENVGVGGRSATQTVTFTNGGTTTMSTGQWRMTGTNPSDFTYTTGCGSSLAPGASCPINFAFTPHSTGGKTAALTIDNGTTYPVPSVSLAGTGTATPVATIGLSPTSVAFVPAGIGIAGVPRAVTISNTGGAPLTISGVSLTGANVADFSQTNDCPATLAAGAHCTANVTFTPSATAARTASLSIADNAQGSPHTVALSGLGLPAGTYLSDGFESGLGLWSTSASSGSSIAIDSTVSSSGSASARLRNASANQSARLTADLGGGGHAQTYTSFCFRIATGLAQGIELANGRDVSGADPNGARRWVLDYNPVTRSLEGYFFNNALQRLDLYTRAGSVDMGSWHCAEVYVDEEQSGHARLTVDGVVLGSVDGDLSTPSPYGRLVLWNEPSAGTVWFDDVLVASTSSMAVTPPPSSPAQATLTPASLAFGSQTVGVTTGAQSVTLANTGGSPLGITSIGVTADEFAQTNDCPASLPAGAACTVHVTFTPGVAAARAASLTVVDGASGSPHTVALTGRGLAPGTYLADGFEDGLGQWIAYASASDSSVAVDTAVASSGASSARLANGSADAATRLYADLAGGGHAQTDTRFCFRIAPGLSQGIEIANGRAVTQTEPLGIRRWVITYNPVTNGLEGYFFNDALQRLDLYAANSRVTPGSWHCAELELDESANGHAALSVDGVAAGRVDGDLSTPTPYSRLYLWNQPSAGTVWFDDVAVTSAPSGSSGTTSAPAAVTLAPASLSFGAESVGDASGGQRVTVTNSGGSPLAIGGIAVGGADPAAFVQTNDCPASLPAGASCTVTVVFAPDVAGAAGATLTFADGAADSPQAVALSGVALPRGTYLTDGFESGLGHWDAYSSGGSSIALDSSTANGGATSVRLTNASADQSSRLAQDLAGGGRARTATRFCFRVAPGLAQGIELADGRAVTPDEPNGIRRWIVNYNPATQSLEGYFFNDALQRLDLYTRAGSADPGEWHCARLDLDESTNGHAALTVDGVAVGSVDGDLATPNAFSRLSLWNQPALGTVWFDDVSVSAP